MRRGYDGEEFDRPGKRKIRYELMFFFLAGFRPKDLINKYGVARGTAYRWNAIYRHARKKFREMIEVNESVSPAQEY